MTRGLGARKFWMAIAATVLAALFGATGQAQAANPLSPTQSWTQQSPAHSPAVRFSHSMAFDPANGETVMFGGLLGGRLNDTWTWDGTDWAEQSPVNRPSNRNAASMAFDPNTGKVLLFGGLTNSGFSNETWTWDGTNWTQLTPVTSPPARAAASMAFDTSTGEMVLFGGSSGSLRSDTWTWDGTTWTARTPVTNPPERQSAPMAFDPSTGEVVMFGGNEFGGPIDDTWAWTGTNWVQKAPATKPPAQGGGGMAFDPLSGELVLFGNVGSTPGTSESWSWDGSNWEAIESAANPLPVNGPGVTFDAGSGNIVLFGGQAGSSNNQTWTYGPPPGLRSRWFEQDPANKPSGRNASGSTFDQSTGTTVLYGGFNGVFLNQTWNWNGDDWSQALPTTNPPALQRPDLAFDPTTGNTFLYANTNWSWSGTDWTQLFPASSPSTRFNSALAYDPSMGKLLLFGGTNSSVSFDETWTWNGSTWTQLSPAHSPPARSGPAMAFDESTGNMVMFGGGNGSDTWVWDGADWTEMSPANHPSARSFAEMDFDPTSGDLVLYGGTDSGGDYPRDTWRWDGSNWIVQPGTVAPSRRAGPTMSFSPRSGGMVLFGGYSYDLGQQLNDTWTYELIANPPTAEIASPGSGGTYVIDEVVPTAFACADDGGGPGVASCVDSNGDTGPGELDTSTLGSHTYTVTATSENGQTGQDEISYEVVKADPVLTVGNATSVAIGGSVTADAVLASGLAPTGTITFRAYGPDDPTCSGSATLTYETPEISGNGMYPMPAQDFSPAGDYNWVANYPGDANNEATTSACGATGSVSKISKLQPTLKTSGATSADLGVQIEVEAALASGHSPTGHVTFAAFGPDDANCSKSPAFTSDPIAVTFGDVMYVSPGFAPNRAGDYRWVATYSGDGNNEPTTSDCGAAGSVSTVTDTSQVCRAVKLDLDVKTFKPNRRAVNRQVPGVRVLMKTNFKVWSDLVVSYRYRINGKTRTARLMSAPGQIDKRKRALLGIPPRMSRQLRRATGHVSRNPVTVRISGQLLLQDENFDCRQKIRAKTLKTRISGVSNRKALRRLPSW